MTYLSLLRGINVGGHKIIKMGDLRAMYVAMNFQNVQSYIQSGNVIFQFENTNVATLSKQIELAIAQTFALNVPVLVIKIDALTNILNNNPFLPDKDEAHLYITLLYQPPALHATTSLDQAAFVPDEFKIDNNVIYLFTPRGISNSKLTNSFFEKKYNCSATTRNYKTMRALLNIAETTVPQSSI